LPDVGPEDRKFRGLWSNGPQIRLRNVGQNHRRGILSK
jgi:hypothetical protein